MEGISPLKRGPRGLRSGLLRGVCRRLARALLSPGSSSAIPMRWRFYLEPASYSHHRAGSGCELKFGNRSKRGCHFAKVMDNPPIAARRGRLCPGRMADLISICWDDGVKTMLSMKTLRVAIVTMGSALLLGPGFAAATVDQRPRRHCNGMMKRRKLFAYAAETVPISTAERNRTVQGTYGSWLTTSNIGTVSIGCERMSVSFRRDTSVRVKPIRMACNPHTPTTITGRVPVR